MTDDEWSLLDRVWGEREPEPVELAFGPWRFRVRGDEIADLRFDGTPIVRSVRAVVRDGDWNTVPTTVEGVAAAGDGYELLLRMRGFGADVTTRLSVAAEAERITMRLHAISGIDFTSNRLGLVVLHPPGLAGSALQIQSPCGSRRSTVFPRAVAPDQPAMDIRSLGWSHDGVQVTADFDGDVFEMEDQRNWTDASYKTYSTPLARPFPVTVVAGAVIQQSVGFTARRTRERAPRVRAVTPVIELADTGCIVPAVALGATTAPSVEIVDAPIPDGVAALLVEADTRSRTWRAALERAGAEAGGLPLDVRIVSDEPEAVRDVVEAAALSPAAVLRLAVFSSGSHVTEPACWAALLDAAGRLVPGAELVGGSRAHFTELNRRHDDLPVDVPRVTFAMTPQMHATERAQLMESIAMQAVVTRDATAIAAGRPLHVGPITLRPRFNAVATRPMEATGASTGDAAVEDGYGPEFSAGATDARQTSVALEAWTVASFAAICSAGAGRSGGGVASVTYFEASGPRGIRNLSGPYPALRAISAIAGLGGATLLTASNDADAEAGLTAAEGLWAVGAQWSSGAWRVLVASLTGAAVTATVRYAGDEHPVTVEPFTVSVLGSEPAQAH
ncbi:MAG TPA: hypothetical protein VN133_05535 [Humibacter sp.]|nr:hypothetical protein [Humibacter sp.]